MPTFTAFQWRQQQRKSPSSKRNGIPTFTLQWAEKKKRFNENENWNSYENSSNSNSGDGSGTKKSLQQMKRCAIWYRLREMWAPQRIWRSNQIDKNESQHHFDRDYWLWISCKRQRRQHTHREKSEFTSLFVVLCIRLDDDDDYGLKRWSRGAFRMLMFCIRECFLWEIAQEKR